MRKSLKRVLDRLRTQGMQALGASTRTRPAR
jgi:hypothetical protein